MARPQSSRTSCRFANPLPGAHQQPGKAGSAVFSRTAYSFRYSPPRFCKAVFAGSRKSSRFHGVLHYCRFGAAGRIY
jgi:hypothetical protein